MSQCQSSSNRGPAVSSGGDAARNGDGTHPADLRRNGFGAALLVVFYGCRPSAPCPDPSAAPPAPPPSAPVVLPLPPSEVTHGVGLPFPVIRHSNQRIEFGDYGFEVAPAEGGRILEFSLGGRSIVVPFVESPEAYGSSIWPSPQSDWVWPPPPEFDRLPWQVVSDPKSLVMRSQTSRKLGLALCQRLTALPKAEAMLLEYEFSNRGERPCRVAPWQNTRVRPNGLTFYPASRASYSTQYNTLALAPENGVVWFRHEPTKLRESQKSFADGEEGWLAQLDERLLFIKIFDDVPAAAQAPEEGEIVIYVHDSGKFVEVENQGAYRELQPGSSFTWRLLWVLRRLPQRITGNRGDPALVDFVRHTVAQLRRSTQ